MSEEHVPNVSSRRLGRELRTLREARRIPCDEAAAMLGRDVMWLVQIEIGQDQIVVDDLLGLLNLYAVTDEGTRAGLAELAVRAAGPAWLKPHAGWLTDVQRDFIILESDANSVWAFGIPLMPDLLRTEPYARMIATATRLPGSPGSVDEEVDLLLHRQGHHVTGQVRAIHVILDESAITRFVARPDLMRGQLQHLLDRVEQGHTVVQLIPHEVGAHVGLDGAFHILGFPGDAEPNVSISHSALGPLQSYIELDDHFGQLEEVALSPADSLFMIEQALGEM